MIKMKGFPGGSDGKVSVRSAGDPGSIPGSGRSPGEGNCNPVQYSCLENSMDGRAWWATIHGVAKNQTQLIKMKMKTELSGRKSQIKRLRSFAKIKIYP